MDNNAFANPDFNEFINRQMQAWFARKAELSANRANTPDTAGSTPNPQIRRPPPSERVVHVQNALSHRSSAAPSQPTSSNSQSTSNSSQHPSSRHAKHVSYGGSVTHTPSSMHRGGERTHPTPNTISEDDLDQETPRQNKNQKKPAPPKVNHSDELSGSSQSQLTQKAVPRTYDREGKVIQPYKNRKDLAGRMRLEEGGEKDITA
ncbi:hypothetical protein P167DRAFT_569857 [Morchella conica CCBAS932]|uniref:Uncharacterized protein n=1 Tax=Morchella conica CCBAS932 TaxID=1392247 RepID=A0A3N4L7F1_9PEZI|nr:hypothetical protein P167DRAFT_569857 [Morchella conica CCBAS932]